MKPDELEQKLACQPLRQVPAEWRADMLATANASACPAVNVVRPDWLSTITHQLSTIFWPHPKAWAGLAAVWVFIFVVNFSMRDNSPRVAEKSAPPPPEVMVELKKQQRMLVELMGANELRVADRQKIFMPKPRSEWSEILAA